MQHPLDQRRVDYRKQPEAAAEAEAVLGRWAHDDFVLARAYPRLWDTAHYVSESCASLEEWASRRGRSPSETWRLLHAGFALRGLEGLEEALRAGRVSWDQAAQLGRLYRDPERYVRDDDDWLQIAMFQTLRTLRRAVEKRVEETAQRGQRVRVLSLQITEQAHEDFHEGRVIASRKAKRALTKGEAFGVIAADYRSRYEDASAGTGTRRVERTDGPGQRYVPAAVRRELRALFGDRCCVPGCRHRIFVEKAHVTPKRDGAGQESGEQIPLCSAHHAQFDAGLLWMVGRTEKGLPIFETPPNPDGPGGLILHPDFPWKPLRRSASQPRDEGRGADPPATPRSDRVAEALPRLVPTRSLGVSPRSIERRWLSADT